MSSSYPNTTYSHPSTENLTNGRMPTQLYSQQQQQQQQKSQEFMMDKFLPPNTQNFRPNAAVNSSPSSSSLPPPPSMSSSHQVYNRQLQAQYQHQPQQQQFQNVPSSMQQYPNIPVINGGGSTHSSRTASPVPNKSASIHNSVSNQLNSNTTKLSSNDSSRNNLPLHPPLLSNSSSIYNQQQQQQGLVTTSVAKSSPLSTTVVGGNQNISNLNDNMRNLAINQNASATTNGFQNPPPPMSTSNNYHPQNFQVNNFKMSALNNRQSQQQQQSQNLDNHSYYKNSLPSENENRMQSTNTLSMNRNKYVPINNMMYNQQQQQNTALAATANCENRNILEPPPAPSQQQIINNSYSVDNKSGILPPPSSLASSSSSTPTSTSTVKHQLPPSIQQQQNFKKPLYPPVSQQSYDQHQHQQRNVPPSLPSSLAAAPPTFAGQPNTGPLQYPSSPLSASTATSPSSSYGGYPSVTKQGFNKLWGQDVIDLMQHRHILPHEKVQPPRIVLNNQFYESVNCNPDIMRCTLNKIPESNNLLQKSRLPLGVLVHPFRDINSLPVIQCPNIVRCRLCRAYINPFVYFVDSKMWKCNLCYRVNELPEDFQYDPATKTYGDVTRRPEVRSSTIEFIAPSEYMLRPPQPAIYLFLFDVSILAQQSGYLEVACATLLKYLDDMPGDARTCIGFIAFNSEIHFYNIADGYSQPHEMTLVDIDDPFLPRPDNLLVNLKENRELIKDLLNQLPSRFQHSHDPGSALGAALQVAYKLMSATGGRVTVFQTCLPNKGPGALQAREDPNNRSSKDVMHLNPATDFYKRHALECSGYQIAVDLFVLNQQYCDLATISGVSKYSGGSIYHFPLYQKTKPQHIDALKQCLKRYLTRKIGFEAVMRIRCTRGLQVHTFHGNFFVRSTDLLSLPNVNPDAGYGMQISYEENLTDIKTICFQSALLYTNSEGERRIRVHTLCLPVTSSLHELMHSADPQAIVSLLSKMAVDRCMSSSVSDARDAFINATIDIINAFKIAQNLPQGGQSGQLLISKNLSLLPLYISALLKHIAFRIGTSTRLDDRMAAMDWMKTLPLDQLMKTIYPEYYIIDSLFLNLDDNSVSNNDNMIENQKYPPLLQLSAEFIDSRSMFLIDSGPLILIYVGMNVSPNILENVLGIQSTSDIPDYCYGLQPINTPENTALRKFIDTLNDDKPYLPTIQIIRDTSTCRNIFVEKLVDDRSESSLSYYEFLQHLRSQIK